MEQQQRNAPSAPDWALPGVSQMALERPATSPLVAAVDLGSKNFKFILGWLDRGEVRYGLLGKRTLQVGRDVAEHAGVIGADKLAQVRALLEEFSAFCRAAGVEQIMGMATSAIRGAANHAEVTAIGRACGIELEIADGPREGVIGYLAATGGRPGRLVTDTGSSSFQVAWQTDGPIRSLSIPVGYARGYAMHIRNAPTFGDARRAYRRFLEDSIDHLPSDTEEMVAVAGKSVGAFVSGRSVDSMPGTVLERAALDRKIGELGELTPAEFGGLKTDLGKVDKVLSGLLIIDWVMERSGHFGARIVDAELPVGLVVEYFQQRGPECGASP